MAASKEEFVQEVKEVLTHLYDATQLPRLSLTQRMTNDETLTWDARARQVRVRLIEAIEQLNPGDAFTNHARERRSYALLTSRYVRSMTSQEVIEELALSERQYWREHLRAINALVELLWEQYGADPTTTPADEYTESTLVHDEVEHLVAHSEVGELDLRDVAREVVTSIRKVFAARNLRLDIILPESSVLVMASRTVMRQVFLNLLSYAGDVTADNHILIELTPLPANVRLIVRTTTPATATAASSTLKLSIAQQLAASQQGDFIVEFADGLWTGRVDFAKLRQLSILIVDDNAAAIKLFQRYLNNSRYRTLSAQTGREAVEIAVQTQPAVITLDVMMPNQDGWEVLQTLRSTPSLADTPIIVCSVLNEPALAASLGANDFLRKPVTRDALLKMLDGLTAARALAD